MQGQCKSSKDGGRAQRDMLTLQNSLCCRLPHSWMREFVEGLHSVICDCGDAVLLVDAIGEVMIQMVHIEDFNAVR
jgi:hypothetical protein